MVFVSELSRQVYEDRATFYGTLDMHVDLPRTSCGMVVIVIVATMKLFEIRHRGTTWAPAPFDYEIRRNR
jgi:hypothetical protein